LLCAAGNKKAPNRFRPGQKKTPWAGCASPWRRLQRYYRLIAADRRRDWHPGGGSRSINQAFILQLANSFFS